MIQALRGEGLYPTQVVPEGQGMIAATPGKKGKKGDNKDNQQGIWVYVEHWFPPPRAPPPPQGPPPSKQSVATKRKEKEAQSVR